MQNLFFRVGEEAINFANVTHVTRSGVLIRVHLIGKDKPLEFVTGTSAGRALLHWFNETVPAFPDGTEPIPIA